MSLYTDLSDKLYDYLNPMCIAAGINDGNLVFDYDNGVKLEGDFVAIDINSIVTDGHPEVVYRQSQGNPLKNDEIIKYKGTVAFGIDVYSASQAIFKAEEIKSHIWRGKSIEEAQRQGLGFVSHGDTLNLSATQNGRYKHRSQFAMVVNFAVDHVIEETTIGTVGVKGSLDEGKYLIDVTISEEL